MQPTALRALPAGRLLGLPVLPASFQADSRAAADAGRSVEDSDGGEGEFGCHGQAALVDDPATRAMLFDAARAAGFHPQERYVVFEFRIEGASSTQYETDPPIRNRWTAR